jgi:hypothetical protein
MANRKRTGGILSPCFTPDVDRKAAFAFPTLVDTSMSIYIFMITLTSSSGIPHFTSIYHIISRLTELKAFTKLEDRTHASVLLSFKL